MAEENSQNDLEPFLREFVESYEELKALICLGTGRASWWSPESLASECKVDEEALLPALERLCQVGVLARRGEPGAPAMAFEYRLHDDFQSRGELFDRLAVEYRDNPLHLIEVMTQNAFDRVRASALKTFADCFRIRGPKDDG